MIISAYQRGQKKKRRIGEIRFDVLRCLYDSNEKRLCKFAVMSKSNTNCKNLNQIITDFLDKGYINKINKGARVIIEMTDKGVIYYNKVIAEVREK